MHTFGWTDIEDIAIGLYEAHPDRDPFTIRFTELRELVEALDGFEADPDHNVNEQILEAIQVAWREEIEDTGADAADDDGEPSGYSPNRPFR